MMWSSSARRPCRHWAVAITVLLAATLSRGTVLTAQRLDRSGGANGVAVDPVQAQVRAQALEVAAQRAARAGGHVDAQRLLVVSGAIQALGQRYRYGATDREAAYDCSKLVQWAYRRAGVRLPRTSREQDRVGTRVAMDPAGLAWGDLLFFGDGPGEQIGHVGIAIGENKFIHASSHYGQVVVSELRGVYVRRWVDARRVLGSPQRVAVR